MTIYGTIIDGKHVRAAMTTTIAAFFPAYLIEVARQHEWADPEGLPVFRSYVPALDLEKFVEDQLPACVIVAPGLIEPPRRRGGGLIDAAWSVGVGAVVSGQDRNGTFELIEMYAAAVRALVVQHPSLGGFATSTDWLGETYDELDTIDSRTIAAGIVQFRVVVESAVDSSQGPLVPPDDPTEDPGSWHTVDTVDVDIEKV